MDDHRDDQLNQDEFSLEAILAEFGSGNAPSPAAPEGPPATEEPAPPPSEEEPEPAPLPPEERKEPQNWREDTIPFPIPPRRPTAPPAPGEVRGVITAFPGARTAPPPLPENDEPDEPMLPPDLPPAEQDETDQDETKVLEFPSPEPENPVAAGIGKLRRKADEFAGHMFEEEGAEARASVRRAEKLIPGVDEEEAPSPVRERKPRRQIPAAPDVPPADLAKRYGRGLKGAQVRLWLLFLLTAGLIYLSLAESFPLPIPVALAASPLWRCYALAGCQGAVMLLGFDALLQGLIRPFRLQTGLDTIVSLANLATLADALFLPSLSGGAIPRQPLCAAAALALLCVFWGNLQKRRGQRLACRTAASVSEPYLVTRDEKKWNNRDTYAKSSGPPAGFGSQIQASDGAERIYRILSPLILLACLLFSLISSLGRQRPENFLWCLSAILTSASALSATLCFGRPWRRLCARLSKSGAALAGWEGVVNTTGSSNILLSDADLFPPGSVTLNGVKIFGDFPIEKVIAVTASIIRDSGCGLDKVFYDLLRSQGAVYRRGGSFTAYEGGGLSEVIRGEQVLVGSAPFMVLMDVALPPGLNVKNAVFCAIDGELAGIFALNYHLPGAVAPAIDSLIHNRITPVLATRDFNLIPAMLRQRFKLPVEKMEFPPVARRRELSDPQQEHSPTLTAILCREGVGPYAEAAVGGRRLRSAVRLSAVLACLGSVVGALLAFYLTFVCAYDSLTTLNLIVFLLMWLVPAPLITGWVDRY